MKFLRENPQFGKWFPKGKMEVVGHIAIYRENPPDWESWGKPTFARLMVGLYTSDKVTGRKRVLIQKKRVHHQVFGIRVDQVGRRYGASFVAQAGHYIPDNQELTCDEKKCREPSLQVIVFPADTESWKVFVRNIKSLASELLLELYQDSIITEFTRNGVGDEVGRVSWKGRRPKFF